MLWTITVWTGTKTEKWAPLGAVFRLSSPLAQSHEVTERTFACSTPQIHIDGGGWRWENRMLSHPSPIYAVRSSSLTLLSEVKSDLHIELWTLYLIHVLQSFQKNIFIHSMHNNDLQNTQRRFSYLLFSNFLSSTKCLTALSSNTLQNIILWQYI